MNKFTFKATAKAECEDFLKIKMENEEYSSIDEFIKTHQDTSDKALENCVLKYRGKEETYKEFLNEHIAFSNDLKFVQFDRPLILIDKNIIASSYFIEKAADCLQKARFFTMQSQQILDLDINITINEQIEKMHKK